MALEQLGSPRSLHRTSSTLTPSTGAPNTVRSRPLHFLVTRLLTYPKGWIWGPSCFITVIWVYFYLPEIKNRTLEEIDEMFEARLPARKFRKYVCTGRFVGGGDDKTSDRRDSEKDETIRQEVVTVEKSG